MATYIVRVGPGADTLKLSELLGECDQDVVAFPLPKASRRIHAPLLAGLRIGLFSHQGR
jgi:hypothetical protein